MQIQEAKNDKSLLGSVLSDPISSEQQAQVATENRLLQDDVRNIIEKAAGLLPITGPITAFAFLNTLQALESRSFEEGIVDGAALYGAEPYLSREKYRAHFARGRIRTTDLESVLQEILGASATESIAGLGTRQELRMRLLQQDCPRAPEPELKWHVAESGLKTQFMSDVSAATREHLVDETRLWVLRDLQGRGATSTQQNLANDEIRGLLNDLLPQFQPSSIERWNAPTREWEKLTLEVLWRVCTSGMQKAEVQRPKRTQVSRLRDKLLSRTGKDADNLVHDVLIRFCAAFTDQGLARRPMPERQRGFLQAFCSVHCPPTKIKPRWLRPLPDRLADLAEGRCSPLEYIINCLNRIGIARHDWEDYLTKSLLALRGWSGLIWQMEQRPDRFPCPAPSGTLLEFLAVRLGLDELAAESIAQEEFGPRASLADLYQADIHREPTTVRGSSFQTTLQLFCLAQGMGWTPPVLHNLEPTGWNLLAKEIEDFSELERRRVFHLAYERNLQRRALNAVSVHARRPVESRTTPRFQVACCIDAREESFRRHLEEAAPDVETFGLAGFFGVPMYYRGAGEAHFSALCPIVIKPKHWVVEDVTYTLEATDRRRARTRRTLGTIVHRWQVATQSPGLGAFLATGFGVLAAVPMVGRVLFPRLAAKIRRGLGSMIEPPRHTRLRLERASSTPGPSDDQIGFSVDEMADIAERMLRDIGLTSNFARLVFFLGHGASALNNPHKSAYDCGACSGSPGGANSRALAAMLNDRRVRERLERNGLTIPDDTLFIGGLHNTTTDRIRFFDLDKIPQSHYREFEAAVKSLEEACQRNSHERCRRFDSARIDLSLAQAHLHVEARSEDLAQPRPEFGNATNAFCFVGRRSRTRGLFLDRRCFLSSYDPALDDPDASILLRILSAVVPVCEGINMQYYLSATDSTGWGCGTKLPHNISSLVGVMDGAASDLRPGLPWQGVEIHEPVRITFIIETSPAAILSIMERNPTIRRILGNSWALLAVLDPHSNVIQTYSHGQFQVFEPDHLNLPTVATSVDCYRGWRDHLDFVQIGV